ncbi:hypothetical protein [Burkholderia sp. Se-20378]|uniref:hypothetical protein n=1 Tax=Burkholderia sp. Se-20378 TaxID=2703899 RepID=UPI00197EFC02|nr:hypothetical protein [Burkholderia sp. Se-20378]MBN3770708.1 hypothetical protein [Burkholderia sp. Se-20378]
MQTVEYFEKPDFVGMMFFRCERLRADLSPSACARNQQTEKFLSCCACPIGQLHSQACGRQAPAIDEHGQTFLPVQTARPCVRCGVASLRLVRKELCVGCYNRQRELKHGRNAKGGPPRRAAARLHPARCLIDRDGAAEIVELEFCTGDIEAAAIVKRRWPKARLADYERLQ